METKTNKKYGYKIVFTQNTPCIEYSRGEQRIVIGLYIKPKKDVQKYANFLTKHMGNTVKVTIEQVKLNKF